MPTAWAASSSSASVIRKELIGQQIGQRTVEEVTNELARIEPPAFPEVETVAFKDNRVFIVLRVPGGGGLFSYDGRYYVRVGPTTRLMPGTNTSSGSWKVCTPPPAGRTSRCQRA